jgi:2-iminobutanoate/2-iminopropanoate deaminase
MKQAIVTNDAPEAIGPYSQAIRFGDMLFLSGQIPIDPATKKLVQGDITTQTERVIKNLDAVLKAAGASLADVVKTTIFLIDLRNWSDVNAVYSKHFAAPYPARATVQVAALPLGAQVEIEAIAVLKP